MQRGSLGSLLMTIRVPKSLPGNEGIPTAQRIWPKKRPQAAKCEVPSRGGAERRWRLRMGVFLTGEEALNRPRQPGLFMNGMSLCHSVRSEESGLPRDTTQILRFAQDDIHE